MSTDSKSEQAERMTRTVAECAAELGVSPDSVVRWIEAGHLAAFIPPGKSIGDPRPGPKGYLIFRADWEAFLRSRTMSGSGESAPTHVLQRSSRPPVVAGTDGISRRRRPRP